MSRHSSIQGVQVFTYPPDAPMIHTPQNALNLIGDALSQSAELVVIPAHQLDPSFFQLRSGFAGEVIQKFVNYRIRLVVIGDISAHTAVSDALRDFVSESNRGRAVWFLTDMDELKRRLARN